MGKLFLYLLLVFAAASDARVRGWVMPYVQSALDPVHEWSARSNVAEIARLLETEAARGRELPDSEGLATFLTTRRAGFNPDRDPWGTPYFLRQEFYVQRVASAGRDRVPGTDDDVVSMVLDLPAR